MYGPLRAEECVVRRMLVVAVCFLSNTDCNSICARCQPFILFIFCRFCFLNHPSTHLADKDRKEPREPVAQQEGDSD